MRCHCVLLSHLRVLMKMNHVYQTLFEDHPEGEEFTNPRSIMRMRFERAKVPWSDLLFEPKALSHQSYDA